MSFKRKIKKRSVAHVRLNVIQRTCGECKICCTEMAVDEIQKPAKHPCKNLCNEGCRIYQTRPKACEKYYCAWLAGKGDDIDRPDKSGIMFGIADQKIGDIRALVAHEVKENAFETREDLLARMVEEGELLILLEENQRRVIGPPEKVEQLRIFLDSVPKSFGGKHARLFG